VAEVAKELGKRWKALTDEERSDWQAKSAASKAAAKEAAEAAQEGGIDGDLDAEQQAGQQPKQDAKAPPSSNDTAPVLPLSVVKRLIMLDPDVTRISAEALVTVAYAAELFLGLLTSKMTNTCHQASRGKRRTLKVHGCSTAALAESLCACSYIACMYRPASVQAS
jgi:histone H3/H4